MDQLAAFLAATLGGALATEAALLLLYVFLINIRRSVWAVPVLSGECGADARRASIPEVAGATPAPGPSGASAAPGVESAR